MVESVPTSDALFHRPAYRDRTWVETNWFPFLVPERNLRGHLYAGFRPNLDVVMSLIVIWGHDCATVLDTEHYDHQVHLPIPPQNLDHYALANGLEVRMHEPLTKWTIRYEGFRGTVVDMEATAMMPALSSHVTRLPEGADFSHFHHVDPALASSIGHIDQTMMFEGELRLHGETIPISFPSNRDHTWSPRPEYGHGCGYFDEGFWGEDFAFHVQTKNTELESAPVTNGYLLDHGEVILLKAGTGRYEMDGWYTKRLVYELEDERGRSHRIVGEPTSTFVLPTWPNQFNIVGVARWTYEGDVGWGEWKWHWETTEMQARGGARPAAVALGGPS
jgi:hypothetical protein